MFKLITKRGIIQNHVKTKSFPVDFKITAFDVECRWQFKSEDLEKNDDVILVGYMATDEYTDPMFYVCAYFNISKNKRSVNKQQGINILITSVIALLFTGICWLYTHNTVIGVLFFFGIIMAFFSLKNLTAYNILEKEIKKSEYTPSV